MELRKLSLQLRDKALPRLEAGATRASLGMTTNTLKLFACDS
jgi:hypothetical protein